MAALNQPCLNIAMAAMVSQRIPRRSPRNAKSKHFSPWWPQERPTYAATQWLGPDFFWRGKKWRILTISRIFMGRRYTKSGWWFGFHELDVYIYIYSGMSSSQLTNSIIFHIRIIIHQIYYWLVVWNIFSCFPFYSGMSSCQVTIFQRARAKNHQKSTKILPMWPRWLLRRTACLALFNQQARRSVGL